MPAAEVCALPLFRSAASVSAAAAARRANREQREPKVEMSLSFAPNNRANSSGNALIAENGRSVEKNHCYSATEQSRVGRMERTSATEAATETENNENLFASIGFRVCDSIVYIMSLQHCSSYIIGRALNSIFSRRFIFFCSIRKR